VPLRAGFEPRPYKAPASGPKRVLILGGSQGAKALNDVMPRAIARVASGGIALTVLHQAGRDNDRSVRAAYEGRLSNVDVVPFLDDIAKHIVAADLVVARAGAVTVAEVSAIGRAAILVPFPHAADDHQAKNALSLAGIGGAVCIRQEAADEARLAGEIARLLSDDAARTRMADAARGHGRPTAAEDVARDLLGLAGVTTKKRETHKTNGSASPLRARAKETS
jgi:UDP-N-acetylglucosamine--N-acetylmuramyl-(pentapeptide) pyrophosphoryl-undecaprenol N-acetylglucosamine transferase